MFLKAYCILDTKTGVYLPPFYQHHDAMALRMIYEACADERSSLAKYPSDYVLVRVGEFDDSVGLLSSIPHVSLGNVASIYAGAVVASRQTEIVEQN